MSAETKRIFDQLTEDAMKLMEENGEFSKCAILWGIVIFIFEIYLFSFIPARAMHVHLYACNGIIFLSHSSRLAAEE